MASDQVFMCGVIVVCCITLANAICNQMCTDDWNPVCAKNNKGDLHIFSNPCEFDSAQCMNPSAEWIKTRNTECREIGNREKCPRFCTADWKPVCARDYKGEVRTFGNQCQFESTKCQNPSAGWSRIAYGECPQTRKECTHVCTLKWNPICAKNFEGKYHTFGNPCEFEAANCLNPSIGWVRTRNGICPELRKTCPSICSLEWNPVCAKNYEGKQHTFGNLCELETAQCLNPTAGWLRTRNGICAETREKCSLICTLEWEPVCATNYNGITKTFGNSCQFRIAQCQNPTAGWIVSRSGQC